MPGMFANTDWRSALMAFASGMMARRNPQAAHALAGMLQAQQQAALDEQNYQRQRHDKREDFVFEHDYEAQHPKPASPHYFEDNTGNLMMVGPDGQPTMVYKDPNPWKLVPNGMGGVIPVNMQELMGGSAPKPVGKITPLGGPTPPASGGFPGY